MGNQQARSEESFNKKWKRGKTTKGDDAKRGPENIGGEFEGIQQKGREKEGSNQVVQHKGLDCLWDRTTLESSG